MKKVGFIGGYDKTNLLLYIARILTLAEKRVLLVDASILQKTRYLIPTISPTTSYVTEFEGFDVAVGFKTMDDIMHYLGLDKQSSEYDVILVDIDTVEAAENFGIEEFDKNCFVTDFDLYSLKKGVEVLSVFKKPVKVIKILFSKNLIKEENEYLEYLALGYKAVWEKEILSFPIELANYSVMIENQIISRIKMKKLSDHYKNSLVFLVSMIFDGEITESKAKKIIKTIEKV